LSEAGERHSNSLDDDAELRTPISLASGLPGSASGSSDEKDEENNS
jgi:hypothetical protein